MNTLSEAELKDFFRNRAVKQLYIVQNGSGEYHLAVTLTWKEGVWKLLTSRRTIREWASLDRLALHIRKKYGIPPAISLSLHNLEIETNEPDQALQTIEK